MRSVVGMTTLRHRLALVTWMATLVLVVFGGLVTNTGSALAVPDWPTTFGHNMFLFPWSAMVGGIFYEHSHRLLGALVGLLTLGLAAVLWPAGGRLRVAGLAALGIVIVQGVLGGLRVVLLQPVLAIVHGCLAQAFLALLAILVLATWPGVVAPTVVLERSTRALALAAAGLIYLQIVFGALLTHAGWLELHLTGALAVFVVAPMLAARLRRSADPVAARVAPGLTILLVVQLILGAATLAARSAPELAAALALALPVAHRLVASLILGAAVVLAVRAWSAPLELKPSFSVAEHIA
ncbi:MAG TPA: COX15/CtaA family protein [Methylomirabilota bacterium]